MLIIAAATLLQAIALVVAILYLPRLAGRGATLITVGGTLAVLGRQAHSLWLEVIEPGSTDRVDHVLVLVASVLLLAGVQRLLHALGAQAALARAREQRDRRTEFLIDEASDGIFLADMDGRYLDVNKRGAEMVGYPRPELLQKRITDLIHPEDLASTPLMLDELRAGRTVTNQRRLFRKDGTILHTEVGARMLPDGTVMAIIRDVTERYESAAKLERTTRFLQGIIAAAPVAISVIELDGVVIEWNAAAESLFGWTREDVLGQPLPIVPETGMSEHIEFRRRVQDGTPASGVLVERRSKDGSMIAVRLHTGPIRDEHGEVVAYLGMLVDVRAQQELEDRLHQAQKMEAVGQLAGGIAHDFNNVLTAIVGYAELLASEAEEPERVLERSRAVLRSAGRAARLVQQLLAFSRKQVLEPRLLNLKRVVAETEQMLAPLIGADVTLRIECERDVFVQADPVQMEQVLLNLAFNSRDAMPSGGVLTIEVTRLDLDAKQAASLGFSPGPHARIRVTDTGLGMDEDTRRQIFDPFFTTKATGKGTGLGLATVYGIVRQSGGQIRVESEPGQGTCFTIKLPLAEPPAAAIVLDEPSAELPAPTAATILVVEDEEDIREIAAGILERAGYTVLVAADPDQALALAADETRTIDLLLSDVVLPSMNGPELAALLVEQRPGLPVLYTSGYPQEAVVERGILPPHINYIRKPWRPRQLVRRIGRLIGEHRAKRSA